MNQARTSLKKRMVIIPETKNILSATCSNDCTELSVPRARAMEKRTRLELHSQMLFCAKDRFRPLQDRLKMGGFDSDLQFRIAKKNIFGGNGALFALLPPDGGRRNFPHKILY
jgi:hypothetical protein